MYRNKYLKYICSIIMIIIIILLLLISQNNSEFIKYIIIYDIFLLIISSIFNRKNNIIVIFNLFLLLYYLPIAKKILLNYRIEPFNYTLVAPYINITILSYSIFCIIFSVITIFYSYKINKKIDICKHLDIYNNKIIFYTIITIIIVLIFISHKGKFVLMGGYGSGVSSTSILNEYLILLFPIAYIYSGKIKKRIIIMWTCMIIYALINILYGDRIGIFMLSIMMFLIFFNNKLEYKKIILIMIILGLVFVLIGNIRIYGGIDTGKKQNNIIENNMGNVFVASNQIIELKSDVTRKIQIESGLEYITRIFIPSKYLSDISDPGSYVVYKYKQSLGGGFIASYFYFWDGWIGVVIISVIVSFIIVNIREFKKNYKIIFILAFISFFPRWIAYQPIQLIKIPLIAIVIYFIICLLNKNKEEI